MFAGWLGTLRICCQITAVALLAAACAHHATLSASGAARVSWRMACERGAIRLTARLTPTLPSRIQSMQWRVEATTPSDTKASAAPARTDPGVPCSE
jgi:hypothetical protein